MKRQKIYPRLCIIKNWGTSYGFNLTSRKFRDDPEYHYINDVAGNSSAMHAGLEKHDRVVEVNGVHIGNENHKQIVKRILLNTESVCLLVLKPEDYEIFRQSRYPSSALMPYAKIIEGPDSKPENSPASPNPDPNETKTENANELESSRYKLKELVLRTDSWTSRATLEYEAKLLPKPTPSRKQLEKKKMLNDVIKSSNSELQKSKSITVASLPSNEINKSSQCTTKVNGDFKNDDIELKKLIHEPCKDMNFVTTTTTSALSSNLDSISSIGSKEDANNKPRNPRVQSKYNSPLDVKDKMRMINEL